MLAQAEAGLNKLNQKLEMGMEDAEWDKMPVIPKGRAVPRVNSREMFKELLAGNSAPAPSTAPARLGGGGSDSMAQASKPEIGLSLSQDDLVDLVNSPSPGPATMPPPTTAFGVPSTETSGSSSQPTKPVISRLFGDEDDDDDDDDDLAESGNNLPITIKMNLN